jgi:hypothetical protein
MIIVHGSQIGHDDLLVCIPIKNTNATSNSSSLLDTILNTASTTTPTEGSSTTLNTSSFNLNTFLFDKKPYYSYSGTLPYQPCNSNVNFIVFNIVNCNLDITNKSFSILKNIIQPNTYQVKTDGKLFYNDKGANSVINTNEIYIDCKPTDISEETTQVTVESYTSNPIDFKNVFNSSSFQIILFTFVIFFVILIFYYFLKYSQQGTSSTT